MTAPIFIGNEISAVVWRLAGFQVRSALRGEEQRVLTQAMAEAHVVLIDAVFAHILPKELLDKALTSVMPLVLVVPDMRGEQPMPDLSSLMQSQLGIET